MPRTPPVAERLSQRDELIESLSANLGTARVRIAELEARLGQTSKNSSKPLSWDGLAKPASNSLRKRSARKPGGQAGYSGSTLAPVAVPDEVIAHEPGCCRGCGEGLGGVAEMGRERRQVFDIPPISDAWAPYDTYETSTHALCHSHALHVLRELPLRFIIDPRIPFDNATEREVQMVKPRQKVFEYLRTLTGAQQFCAIRSYFAVSAKHGIHFFAALTTFTEGCPWLPPIA